MGGVDDGGERMNELEKVINGLECCLSASSGETICPTCTYRFDENGVETGDCEANLLKDAIALLKAQEPVAPIFDYDGRDVWRCGNCHTNIFHPTRTDEDENEKNYRRFCFHCGQAVKWE